MSIDITYIIIVNVFMQFKFNVTYWSYICKTKHNKLNGRIISKYMLINIVMIIFTFSKLEKISTAALMALPQKNIYNKYVACF